MNTIQMALTEIYNQFKNKDYIFYHKCISSPYLDQIECAGKKYDIEINAILAENSNEVFVLLEVSRLFSLHSGRAKYCAISKTNVFRELTDNEIF